MTRYRLKAWAPWKWLRFILPYSLVLLPLLWAYHEAVSEAQSLPQGQSLPHAIIPLAVGADDGQWRMAPKDYANLRYSGLDQITTENVKNLQVVFTFSTGVTQGYEAAPLVTTALHSSLLGALLTFAPTPWYLAYAHTTAAWGLTSLEDQQLGGLIMWIPAGGFYLLAALTWANAVPRQRWEHCQGRLARWAYGPPDRAFLLSAEPGAHCSRDDGWESCERARGATAVRLCILSYHSWHSWRQRPGGAIAGTHHQSDVYSRRAAEHAREYAPMAAKSASGGSTHGYAQCGCDRG